MAKRDENFEGTEEQIIDLVRQYDAGDLEAEQICEDYAISMSMFSRWCRKYGSVRYLTIGIPAPKEMDAVVLQELLRKTYGELRSPFDRQNRDSKEWTYEEFQKVMEKVQEANNIPEGSLLYIHFRKAFEQLWEKYRAGNSN